MAPSSQELEPPANPGPFRPFLRDQLGRCLRRLKRHPACRRREAQSGSCMERENLDGDAKGKSTSGSNREAESTDASASGLPCSSEEAGKCPLSEGGRAIDMGSGQPGSGQTDSGRNPMFNGRRQPSHGGTSRMMREYQVRICDRLGVKFLGPTRQPRRFGRFRRMSVVTPIVLQKSFCTGDQKFCGP